MRKAWIWIVLLLVLGGFAWLRITDYPLFEDETEQRLRLETEITQALASYSDSIEIKNAELDTIGEVFQSVCAAHPEFFWLSGGYTSRSVEVMHFFTKAVLTPALLFDKTALPAMDAELRGTVAGICAQCEPTWSDREKALFVHDLITEGCDYDTELRDRIIEDSYIDTGLSGTTAYGCLVEHRAVCGGYSNAFALLMKELGIPCGTVCGSVDGSSAGHAWNYISLDGQDYFVDVTWDDAAFNERDASLPNHSYFCVTGEEISRSHHPDEDQPEPSCTDPSRNYYAESGLYFESYDFDALCGVMPGGKLFEVKFSSLVELEKAEADLFDNNRVFSLPFVKAQGQKSVWHIANTDTFVLMLWAAE